MRTVTRFSSTAASGMGTEMTDHADIVCNQIQRLIYRTRKNAKDAPWSASEIWDSCLKEIESMSVNYREGIGGRKHRRSGSAVGSGTRPIS